MIDFIKRILNKVPKKDIKGEEVELICNNPPENLNSFCSLEYAYMNKRNN